jgi:hypothetical protein
LKGEASKTPRNARVKIELGARSRANKAVTFDPPYPKRLPLESLKDLLSKLAGKGIDAILNNVDQLTDLLL